MNHDDMDPLHVMTSIPVMERTQRGMNHDDMDPFHVMTSIPVMEWTQAPV